LNPAAHANKKANGNAAQAPGGIDAKPLN